MPAKRKVPSKPEVPPVKPQPPQSPTFPPRPHMPSSAFYHFMMDFRKNYVPDANNPETNGFFAIGKKGGNKWKNTTEEERAPFKEMTEAQKKVYDDYIRTTDLSDARDAYDDYLVELDKYKMDLKAYNRDLQAYNGVEEDSSGSSSGDEDDSESGDEEKGKEEEDESSDDEEDVES